MAAVLTPAAPLIVTDPPDGEHVALLRDNPAFAAVPDPALERWIATVRRQANVPCAALSLIEGSRQIVRVSGEASGSPKPTVEISSAASLQEYLLGPATTGTADAGERFAAAPVV